MKPENFTTLSKLELEAMAKALPHMSVKEKMELFDDLELRESRAKLQAAKTNMLGFAQAVYPGFKIGPHHRKLAKIFTVVVRDISERKRVLDQLALSRADLEQRVAERTAEAEAGREAEIRRFESELLRAKSSEQRRWDAATLQQERQQEEEGVQHQRGVPKTVQAAAPQ